MKDFNEWMIEKDSPEITIDENILNAAVNAIANIGSSMQNGMGGNRNAYHNGSNNQGQNQNQVNNPNDQNDFKNKLRTDPNFRNTFNKLTSTFKQKGIQNADAVAQKYLAMQGNGRNNDGRYVVA